MGYGASGMNILEVNDSIYIFDLVSKDAQTYFALNRNILTTDIYGDSILSVTLGIDSHNIYNAFSILNNGQQYIWSGTVGYVNHAASYIIFTDSSFNKTKQLIYGDTIGNTYTFLSIDDACQLASGDLMFCGEEHDTSTTSNSKFQLSKTDSAGKMLWKKNYSYKPNNRAWFIEPTPDGGAIIGGNSFHGATLQGQLRTYDAVVLKVDSAGNEQWHKVWGNPYLNDDWAVVQNAGDGNYIVGTTYAERDTMMNNYNDYSERTINIIKLDTFGNEIWNKKFGKMELLRQMPRLLVLQNGNILAVGNYIKIDKINAPHQYTRAWILMLNSNGDSLFYKEYTHNISEGVENIINDIKPTPDGGYICCGEFSDGLNGIPQSLWVLKLDSTGWYYGMGFGASTPLSHLRKLKVFPNPARDFVTVDLSKMKPHKNLSLHLTNAELKELEEVSVERNPSSIKIDLRNYPSGVYFIRLQSGVEILGVEKVIKK